MMRIILIIVITFAYNILIAQKPESTEKENGFFGINSPFHIDDGTYIGLHIGINADHMKALGRDLEHIKFNSSTQPYVSAILDCDPDPKNGPILRVEIEYKPQSFLGKGYLRPNYYEEYEFKARTYNPCFSFLYKVKVGSKIHVYGGGGVGFRDSKIKMYRHTHGPYTTYDFKDDLELEEFTWTLHCNAGIIFGKRWDLSCKLSRSTWSGESENNRILRNIPLIIEFGYRL